MTFKEKLKIDCPKSVKPIYGGGCFGCPEDYNYESKGRSKHCDCKCTECWNREMPETKKEESTMKKIYYVATNIRESAFSAGMKFTFNDKCGYFVLDTTGDMPDPMFVFYENKEDTKAGNEPLGMIPFDSVLAIYVKPEGEEK